MWRILSETNPSTEYNGVQANKRKSFEMLLKWHHSSPILDYAVKFFGHSQNGNFKAQFCGAKVAESKNFFLNTDLGIIEVLKTQKAFGLYSHQSSVFTSDPC